MAEEAITTDVNGATASPVADTQTAAPTDSSPVETKPTEVADDILDALRDEDEAPTKVEPEAEAEESQETEEPGEEVDTEEKPLGKAEERKQQLNTEIRDLVTQRKALREEIEQLHSQVYQPQSVEELQNEGMDETRALVESMRQEREVERYNNQVVEAQLALTEQSGRVIQDFPMFDPDSKEFDADVASQAAEALDAVLIRDPNTGQVIGSHVSPYQIYKPIADAYAKSRLQGQIKGQKATEKMLASVDATPSATPPETKKDPLLEILSSDD